MRPFHLQGARGALAAVYYPPQGPPWGGGDVLVIPAFAEEMNRCRAMVAIQARALASTGIGTLILDPFGTGDSDGDFSEASWELWADDLRRGLEWLRREGRGCRSLWGVRLGAIMAAQLAASDRGIDRLLYWQPVIDAKAFYTQFLRIRVAAEMERARAGGIKTTDQLRAMSAQGEVVEVSGYRIGPGLASDLDRVRLPAAADLTRARVLWCEVLPATDASVGRANLKCVEQWREAGVRIELERVIGPSFWQMHERVVAPDLVASTTRMMAQSAESPGQQTPERDTDAAMAPNDIEAARDSYGAGGGQQGEAPAAGRGEYPTVFPCNNDELMGVIHRGSKRRGVVIVVAGGPQYRAGAHRQFVSLARRLAGLGYPVLRFDLRGMGDSGGTHLGFQHSQPDIRAAIDTLIAREPAVQEVVLFGECESASGILFYAYRDARVAGVALVNPWLRTEGGRAEVIIKHYYFSRLLDSAFWRKLFAGEFALVASLRDLVHTVRAYWEGRKLRSINAANVGEEELGDLPLPAKTAVGLRRFTGPALILMSGHDYIAREFDEVVKTSAAWKGLLTQPRIRRLDVPEADHTFSREIWKRQAADWICQWIASW